MAAKARKDFDGPPVGNIDLLQSLGDRFGAQILTGTSLIGNTRSHVIQYADLPTEYDLRYTQYTILYTFIISIKLYLNDIYIKRIRSFK